MDDRSHKDYRGHPNELLRRERLLRGWSFKDVSDHIACPDERLVRRWESGTVFPGSTYRQKLCQLYQKNAEELGLLREQAARRHVQEYQETVQDTSECVSQARKQENELPDPLTSAEDMRHVAQKTLKDTSRQRMLERVKHIWVKGVLAHSLDNRAMMPLKLYEDARIVENPWRHDIQEIDLPARALACDMHITQVYDASHGELLILGEPGAGKTTLLLSLVDELLARAACDDMHPIPVVFHLASWSLNQQELSLWLIEELIRKYYVPPHISRAWVEQDRLLLLLDGLDEVDMAAYESCITAINTYREDHGFVSLVICSRRAEYLSQSGRLLLKNAVTVQPLTIQQIDLYLEQGGETLAKLRAQFAHEAGLQDLVKTPLMLTILMYTYQGKCTNPLLAQPGHVQRNQLFRAYIQQMFQRRTSKQIYTQEQTLIWLSWLARRMKHSHQGAFYIESLQFDCFSKDSQLRHIPIPLFGLIIAGFGWLEYGLFFGLNFGPRNGFLLGGVIALSVLLVYIFVNGFLCEKIRWFSVSTPVRQQVFWENGRGWSSLFKRSFCLLLYGLSFGLPFGAFSGWMMGRTSGLAVGIAYGGYNLFILTVDFMLLGRCPKTIQPVEVLVFSWSNLRKYFISCVGGGLAIGVVLWLFFINEFGVVHALFLALIFGGGFAFLLAASVGMVSPCAIDTQCHLLPNEGIHRSVRNSLVLGGCSGGLGGMFFGLIFLLFGHSSADLVVSSKFLITYGVIPGISVFQIIGLRNGGYAWIQHAVLRFFLWYTGTTPWDYTGFLDYAVERAFLRKVGGGYIFVHRSLLDYFANLNLLPRSRWRSFLD